MRNRMKLAALPLAIFVLGLVVVQAPVASEGDREAAGPALVDFRMAPLEQVKKINAQVRSRAGEASETLTIMTLDGEGEGEHVILTGSAPPPASRVRALSAARRFDSVSWRHRANQPLGSCDSQKECERKTEEMCEDAGHGGVKKSTVTLITHADGSKTCSGNCNSNGAVAFVTCNPN
jgi:hypothetical protein